VNSLPADHACSSGEQLRRPPQFAAAADRVFLDQAIRRSRTAPGAGARAPAALCRNERVRTPPRSRARTAREDHDKRRNPGPDPRRADQRQPQRPQPATGPGHARPLRLRHAGAGHSGLRPWPAVAVLPHRHLRDVGLGGGARPGRGPGRGFLRRPAGRFALGQQPFPARPSAFCSRSRSGSPAAPCSPMR
jgi:hypothetical protein